MKAQTTSNFLYEMWAKDVELRLNPPIILTRAPRAKKLSKRELFWLKWNAKAIYRRMGERITRKLMRHFNIYEDDGYGY